MQLSIISFTKKGWELSQKIAVSLEKAITCRVYTKCSALRENGAEAVTEYVEESLEAWANSQMEEKHVLLFVGACGIAVRAIAGSVKDKLTDSPVLVMDELGQYVIPLLSGHVGGANELAGELAAVTGAIPVITTATDLNHKFAVDLFAKRNGLYIENKEGIARVSSQILEGKSVTLGVEPGHLLEMQSLDRNSTEEKVMKTSKDELKDKTSLEILDEERWQEGDIVISSDLNIRGRLLTLRPKEYILGMGCKKGKEASALEAFIMESLTEARIDVKEVLALASIDRKAREAGLLACAEKLRLDFWTYSAEELQAVEGEFTGSDFVKKQVGVDNVCERAALRACEDTMRKEGAGEERSKEAAREKPGEEKREYREKTAGEEKDKENGEKKIGEEEDKKIGKKKDKENERKEEKSKEAGGENSEEKRGDSETENDGSIEKPETKHTAGRLLCRKRTKEGMTLAIARREWRISLDE